MSLSFAPYSILKNQSYNNVKNELRINLAPEILRLPWHRDTQNVPKSTRCGDACTPKEVKGPLSRAR